MVEEAKAKFNAYCAKHGDWGKTQVALENRYLELEKAYNVRKYEIEQNLKGKDVVEYLSSDDFLSYPAFNCMYNRLWSIISDVVISYENGDEDFTDMVCVARGEKRIKLDTLLMNLL